MEVQELCDWQSKNCRNSFITDGQAKRVCVEAINAVIQNKGLLRVHRQEEKVSPSVPGSGAEPAADERRTGTHRNRPDETAL